MHEMSLQHHSLTHHLLPTCLIRFLDHLPHMETLLLGPLRLSHYSNTCSHCLKFSSLRSLYIKAVESSRAYHLLNSPSSCLSPFEAQQASFSESSHRHGPDFVFPTHKDTSKASFKSHFLGRDPLLESIFFFLLDWLLIMIFFRISHSSTVLHNSLIYTLNELNSGNIIHKMASFKIYDTFS